MALQVAPPTLGVGVAQVGAAGELGRVARGGVGAGDAPDRDVGARRAEEALEAVQQRPLLLRREEGVGGGLGAVERGGLPAGADQQVAPRVAQREAGHGRTSSTSASPSASRVVESAPRRSRPRGALATSRRRPARRTASGSAKETTAGPRTRPRRRRGERSSGATQTSPPSCCGARRRRQRPPQRAAGRRQAQRQPGAGEAVRAAPVGGRLGGERRHRRRHDDEPQRPVERPDQQAAEPGGGERPGGGEEACGAVADGEAACPCRRRGARQDEGGSGAERDHADQRAERPAEPAQRHPAGDRQRPPLDRVEAPLGPEDPLVGADRLVASRRSRQDPFPDRPRHRGDLVGGEDEPADHDRRAEEERQVGEAAVEEEEQPDDRDDAGVDLAGVPAQQRGEVVGDVVAGGEGGRRGPAAAPRPRREPAGGRRACGDSRHRSLHRAHVPAASLPDHFQAVGERVGGAASRGRARGRRRAASAWGLPRIRAG